MPSENSWKVQQKDSHPSFCPLDCLIVKRELGVAGYLLLSIINWHNANTIGTVYILRTSCQHFLIINLFSHHNLKTEALKSGQSEAASLSSTALFRMSGGGEFLRDISWSRCWWEADGLGQTSEDFSSQSGSLPMHWNELKSAFHKQCGSVLHTEWCPQSIYILAYCISEGVVVMKL